MNTAEEVDDDRTRCRLLRGLILGEDPVSKEDTKAGARIRFQHVHDGTSGFCRLFNANWREDTVVDGVVEEQDFGRLNEDGRKRQQSMVDQDFNTGGKDRQDGGHQRADAVEAKHGEQHADDADGEVVDEHFETGGHAGFHELVKLLGDPAGKRAHDHGAHEHRLAFRAADTGNGTHDGNGGHDAAAQSADHLSALAGNQNGQQEEQDVRVDGRQLLIRQPAVRDEQCGNETPGNECADVGHDHSREELTEPLDCIFHIIP